jgi:hypothetical protein
MVLSSALEYMVAIPKEVKNMPMGERILVNDRKPSGLDMSIVMNIDRDKVKLLTIIREK